MAPRRNSQAWAGVARRLAATAALCLAAQGCGRTPFTRDRARREEARASVRELDSALDGVEARLHRGRATVRLWEELAQRHKGVTEVACKNAEMHMEGMTSSLRKERAQRVKRLAQAARPAVMTDVPVSGYKTVIPATAPVPLDESSGKLSP